MMTVPMDPPEALLTGRRALEEFRSFEMLDDWTWYPKVSKWGVRCRLCIEPPSDSVVPPSTDWYLLVASTYPWGDIDFCPAKEGGLHCTFQHQLLNSIGDPDVPWRKGKICIETSLRQFDRRGYDREPMFAPQRLAWHVSRAREWLVAASQNNLVQPGEPFELPHFSPNDLREGQIAFVEGTESFDIWLATTQRHGYASVMQHGSNATLFFVSSFMDPHRNEILSCQYGVGLGKACKKWGDALWIRLGSTPILPPWQAPTTLGELRRTLSEQGVDLKAILHQMSHALRDGKRHFALLGFPIPRKVGNKPERFHWQGFILPVLSSGNAKGSWRNESGYQRRDDTLVLNDKVPIDWVTSNNWHSDQIASRGHLPLEAANTKALLVGAGALGSAVAHLLVRMGLKDLLVLDGDLLEVGNLCRHTGNVMNVGQYKAESIASTLNAAWPHARVQFVNKNFGNCDEKDLQFIQSRDVVLDCTASDAFLNELSFCDWDDEKMFISISLGLFARRLFYFAFQGKSFPRDEFARCVSPWIAQEADEYKGLELPRDGIGCWHPVFPARADDMWLMSSMAVKLFEHDCMQRPVGGVFRVFEQNVQGGLPAGLSKAQEVKCPD